MSAMIDSNTVASTVNRAQFNPSTDPRRRRLCINPAVPLEIHPRLTGRQLAAIPYGLILRFDTFPDMMEENFSVDPMETASLNTTRDLLAAEAVQNVLNVTLAGGSYDMGFRELQSLTPLTDEVAYEIVGRVFPPLASSQCFYALETCLSCRIDWLESDECEQVSQTGAAKELREGLLDAYGTCAIYMRSRWREFLNDMVKRKRGEAGLAGLGEEHLHYMRQLHEIHPEQVEAETARASQESQAEIMREAMKEQGQQLVAAMREGRADNSEMDEMRERLRKLESPATNADKGTKK